MVETGTILCMNTGNDGNPFLQPDGTFKKKDPDIKDVKRSLKDLFSDRLQQLPDLILLQEYRQRKHNVLDALPGGSDAWKAVKLFEGSKVPVVVFNTGRFKQTEDTTILEEKARAGDLVPDKPRYTAVQLEVIPKVPGSASPTLLVISWHGPHTGLTPQEKKAAAKEFLYMVGRVVARLGIPALVGGDWNYILETTGQGAVQMYGWSEGFSVEPFFVKDFYPSREEVKKSACVLIDYFCIVSPADADNSCDLSLRDVRAVAHTAANWKKFDHDPIVATYKISSRTTPIRPFVRPEERSGWRERLRSFFRWPDYPEPVPQPNPEPVPQPNPEPVPQPDSVVPQLRLKLLSPAAFQELLAGGFNKSKPLYRWLMEGTTKESPMPWKYSDLTKPGLILLCKHSVPSLPTRGSVPDLLQRLLDQDKSGAMCLNEQ